MIKKLYCISTSVLHEDTFVIDVGWHFPFPRRPHGGDWLIPDHYAISTECLRWGRKWREWHGTRMHYKGIPSPVRVN